MNLEGNEMCKLVGVNTFDGNKVNVASVKKDAIMNMILAASLCPNIDAIVLFGSSLEERCTDESDIDIAIISDKTVSGLSKMKSFKKFMEKVYLFDMRQEYDRLYFKSIEEIEHKADEQQICKEIASKGKIIYRKGAA